LTKTYVDAKVNIHNPLIALLKNLPASSTCIWESNRHDSRREYQ